MISLTAWTRRLVALVVAPTLLVLGGCGGTPESPADAVPELTTTLERVDDALAAGRTEAARRQLEALTSATIEARDVGDLEEAEADRILAAATRLLALLPKPEPEPEPATPSPAPEDEEQEPDEESDDGDDEGDTSDGDGDEDDEKKDEERDKDDKDKGKDKKDDPDDGHGN